MMRKSLVAVVIMISMISILTMLSGCGGGRGNTSAEEDARRTVIRFFGAMQESDREYIAEHLDFDAVLSNTNRDYALQMDSVRTFESSEEIIDDLTEGGLTYDKWFAMQRVVNDVNAENDTALVTVSFISPETNTQYLNKWGLYRTDEGIWKIFNFKMIGDDE